MEHSIEWQSTLYLNFVDFTKAFDRDGLWRLLRHYGVPTKVVNVIKGTIGFYETLSLWTIQSADKVYAWTSVALDF